MCQNKGNEQKHTIELMDRWKC